MVLTRTSTLGTLAFCSNIYICLFTTHRDSQYYMGEFRALCTKEKMNELNWPERDYIVQVARFDPAKGEFVYKESNII